MIKCNLHMHSCLSPCGSLYMSPPLVINELKKNKFNIVALTDHNSSKNYDYFSKLGEKNDILIFPGIEVQTNEDIHFNLIFPNNIVSNKWDAYVYNHMKDIKNNPEFFGYQVIVNDKEQIITEVERLLLQSTDFDLNNLLKKASDEKLLYFPTHLHSSSYAICTVLGFLPEIRDRYGELLIKTVEIAIEDIYNEKFDEYSQNYTIITNSDAHYIKDINSKFFNISNTKIDLLYKKWVKVQNREVKKQIKTEIYYSLRDFLYNKINQKKISNIWTK